MKSVDAAKRMLIDLIDGYLIGRATAPELVEAVDNLVSNDVAAEFPAVLRDALEAFQDELALYVRDEVTQRESEAYFGESTLWDKARAFRRTVDAIVDAPGSSDTF